MTLLIGANLKEYTILAADTRISWHHPLFGFITHRDGDHKIAMCNFGLVTGSGYVDALEAVKKELLTKEINHTDEFLEAVKRLALPKVEEMLKVNPWVKNKTCFLMTYKTKLNENECLRLALVHQQWDYKIGFYEKAVISMPADSSNEECEKYNADLIQKLILFDYNGEDEYIKNFLLNLYNNIKIIAQYFNEISQKSLYVSQDMDFAVQLLNGTVIYGYGDSSKIKEGALHLSIIPAPNQARFLAPEVFKEGKDINELKS